ncbi:MAG TPA: cobalamin biosynthesis protein CbiM [Chloroflexi bacterium]|nr:cobalamin biosynthesis protein CbiM [Chloroflexota bacterium]HCG28909.1 cobalamin biosynthesis protein CbiM [Chloroflexota bacterium]
MHVPDGFLSVPVASVMYIVTAIIVGTAVRQTNRHLKESTAPLMGVLAAFIFAAQMMNFPVAGGTSGHLLGGALAAILVGPWAAVLVMTTVIGVQALVFQDGGLAALGANIFNMGILPAFVGFGIFRAVTGVLRSSRAGLLGGAFVSAWISVMLAALFTSAQLAISGTSPWSIVLPAMLGVHVLIGLGEGAITAGAVGLVLSARPDLLGVAPPSPPAEAYSPYPEESA